MKENMELESGDIAIDRDMEVDSDIGQEIFTTKVHPCQIDATPIVCRYARYGIACLWCRQAVLLTVEHHPPIRWLKLARKRGKGSLCCPPAPR